jgi:hypothetical protein
MESDEIVYVYILLVIKQIHVIYVYIYIYIYIYMVIYMVIHLHTIVCSPPCSD